MCVCASTGSITMYVWQASFRRGGWNGIPDVDASVGGRQHVIHACSSFSRSQYWMSGHHLSLSRSFEPPIFRQLILPTNAVATAGGLLGLFRAALGEVLHQDPAKRDRRLSMPHSNSNQVNSLSYL